jgi:hypothetical protein
MSANQIKIDVFLLAESAWTDCRSLLLPSKGHAGQFRAAVNDLSIDFFRCETSALMHFLNAKIVIEQGKTRPVEYAAIHIRRGDKIAGPDVQVRCHTELWRTL